ncbi:MAG: hypothetical protein PHO91_02395 [Patescibacteria group bacterium]|nr:hypothetical protein [Patescibacteria group bacterium]
MERMPGIENKDKFQSSEEMRRLFFTLKNDYSNEIPEEIIHSTHQNNVFKVRKGGWFQSLILGLSFFMEDHLPDGKEDALKKEVKDFIKYYGAKEFGELPRTRPEDIEAGDAILDKVIKYLEDLPDEN